MSEKDRGSSNIFSAIKNRKKLYPRAHEKRVKVSHPSIRPMRRKFFTAAFKSFVVLQITFLFLFSYVFGALYEPAKRTHNLNVLFVDYDGGAVGESFREAYKSLEGNTFPSLQEKSAVDFETPAAIRHDVCKIQYWAALYIAAGASEKIEAAITGGESSYDKSSIVYYIWNEVRYPAVTDSSISANLNLLSSTAQISYSHRNFTTTSFSPAAVTVFANPWKLTSQNIKTTIQGPRLIYNTIVVILLILQQFFYLGSVNGLYEAFQIYTKLNPHRIIAVRLILSTIYTFIGSLIVTAAIWEFQEKWHVSGTQFVATWATFWLFAHLNFLTLDVFTVWLPPPFQPIALISWVILNIASILVPFQLSNPFFTWGYAMPAHAVYVTAIDIWSNGCNPQLAYSLPVMFAYELSSLALSSLGIHRRCHCAMMRQDEETKAFNARVDMALELEQEKLRQQKMGSQPTPTGEIEHDSENWDEEAARTEIAGAIERQATRERKQEGKATNVDFGPSFGFHFGGSDD